MQLILPEKFRIILHVMEKRDYEDPACPFDISAWTSERTEPIPLRRVLEKADSYFAKNDMALAERHLLYWRAEAENGNDIAGFFNMDNELAGFYRKAGKKEEAYRYGEEAVALLKNPRLTESGRAAATAYLNLATVYKAFSEPLKALPLYEKAKEIYEADPKTGAEGLAGLYNNMAVTLSDLRRFSEAEELFLKAIGLTENYESGSLDRAVTWLNLCDMLMKRDGRYVDTHGKICDENDPDAYLMVPLSTDEVIENYLDMAEDCLSLMNVPPDGQSAYVFEKCAPSFRYYDRVDFAEKLERNAKEIYRKNREKS